MLVYRGPIARPDETLYSLCARIRLANTARCDRDACRSLFGQSMTTHVDEFPVDLAHFCNVTYEDYGAPQDIIKAHCLTPYFFTLEKATGKKNEKAWNQQRIRFSLAQLSNGGSMHWRLCPTCIAKEKTQFGVAYWHRQHQLPGSLMCSLHETLLHECEIPAPLRHNRLLLPDEVQAHKPPNWNAVNELREILSGLAHLNSAILFDRSPEIDLSIARSTIWDALADRGLLSQGGKIDRKYFLRDLLKRYEPLASLNCFAKDISANTLNRLISQLSENIIASPRQQLLLLFHLFGSWESYQSKYQWQVAFCRMSVSPRSRLEPQSIKEQHRKTCIEIREQFPTISRTGLARASGRSFRWLLQNDNAWLEMNFLRNQKGRNSTTDKQLALDIG